MDMKECLSEMTSHILWQVGAIRISETEPFRLTSGNMSPIYVDCRVVISYPAARDAITAFAHWLYEDKKLHADYIAGGETAGIPYASWLAQRLNQPLVYVRKEAKGHGARAQIEGELTPGSTVLLYEDLITDGKSKLSFIQGIRNAGCAVNNCLVVFDRQQGGEEQLAAHAVFLHSLTDLSSCLEVGLNTGFICDRDYQSVRHYLRNPKAWHTARGFSFQEFQE